MKRHSGSVCGLLILFFAWVTISGYPSLLYGQEQSEAKRAPKKTNENTAGEISDELLEKGFKPIPHPRLEHLEEAVAEQLRKGKQMVDDFSKNAAEGKNTRRHARVYGELGHLYHAYDLTEAAEACYHNALMLEPEYLEWNYSLAYLLQSAGRFAEALQIYQRIDVGKQETLRAYLIHIRIGECRRHLNELEQSKKSFQSALKLLPEAPAVQMKMGEIALEEKRYEEAITYLESALQKKPEANKLHYALAMAYRGRGDMDKARHHLSKFGKVGLKPADPMIAFLEEMVTGYLTFFKAGKLAYSVGRYEDAIQAYQKAIKANPERTGALINLGAVLVKMRKYEQATGLFLDAVTLNPENAVAHYNLGILYAQQGKHAKAAEHLQIVVDKEPKNEENHLRLADALVNERRFTSALEHYKKALELKPALTDAWINMSRLFNAMGKHVDAVLKLEEAHKRMPHDGLIMHALAHILATSPDLRERNGKRALDLAIKVFNTKKHFEFAMTVALAYAELNECDKATEWMEKSIQLASNSPQSNEKIMEALKHNLNFFKTQRPCRIPGKK